MNRAYRSQVEMPTTLIVMKIVPAKEVENLIDDARASVDAHRGKAAAAEAKIQVMQEKLKRDVVRVSRAQDELEYIRSLPSINVPSYDDDLSRARRAEAEIYKEIDKAVAELSLNEDRLADAKGDLIKANADLKRLGEQKLQQVGAPLDTSSHAY